MSRFLTMDQHEDPTQTPVDPGPSLPKWPDVFRAWLLFAGVVLPCLCFLVTYPGGPRWQSAAASAYAQLLLSRTPTLALYPFLLYNMTCMILLVVRPARWWGNSLVRFGIHTGVLVAAEYWVVFQVATHGQATQSPMSVAAWVGLSIMAAVIPLGLGQLVLVYKWVEYLFMLVAAILVAVALPWGILVCFMCATPWALAAYATVSLELIRRGGPNRFRFSLAQLLAAFAWFATHFGAWRISFLLMLHEYASLPETPPSGECFLCTAAAKGHTCFVRSEEYRDSLGEIRRVNDQLRILKAFELLLASLSPTCHRALRRMYNFLGPRLAAMLVHPIAADFAYVMLKPAEWIAWLALRVVLRGHMPAVRSLYSKPGRS